MVISHARLRNNAPIAHIHLQKFWSSADLTGNQTDIAKAKYGANSNSLSRYGRSNVYEAFAESFASLNGGNPTAFGKALGDYLKTNKL